MTRTIVPISHDKGFFMSKRISELSEFHLSQHLDWEVTKEAVTLGGSQRLVASVIVRRKPKYYIRNYILVVFMLSTSSFSSFLSRPDDYETRAVVIFTILLAVVAFKYNAGDEIPRVPYSTLFEAYVILNFYALLGIGFITFGFAMVCGMSGTESGDFDKVQRDIFCSRDPGKWYGMSWIWPYDPVYETITGLVVFAIWLGWNVWYWNGIMTHYHENVQAVNESGLKWLKFKYKDGEQGLFPVEKFVLWKKDEEKEEHEEINSQTNPHTHTPPAMLPTASSFASVSSVSSSSTMGTNNTFTNEAMTSPALKHLKIDDAGQLCSNSDGSASSPPDTVKPSTSSPDATSMDLDGLVDTQLDITL